MKQERALNLGTDKTARLLLRFGVPSVLSLVISALYNIVDQLFIGNSAVGTIGNTATSLVFPIITVALAFGLMLGDGTAAYLSLCMGKGEKEKIPRAVGTNLVLGLVIGLLYLIFGLVFLEPVLVFLGAKTPESLAAAKEYAVWILIGMPFFVLLNNLNPVVRADGAPKTAMAATMSGCILNIILDYIFIFPLNMGLAGAALATTIGIVVSFLVSFLHLFRSKSFRLSWRCLIPDLRILGTILKLGLSSFLTQASVVVIAVVSMNMLAKYGALSQYGVNDPQAIIGVIMKVFSIAVNIAVGIAVGAQPIIGYNYGAGKFDRVRQLLRQMLAAVAAVGLIATVLFQAIPGQIVGLFGTKAADPVLYMEFGRKALRIYLLLILFTVVQKAASIFLQSLGSAVRATLLSVIRDVIAFVPFTVLLPVAMGLDGVLWAAPAADVVGMLFSVVFIRRELSHMQKKQKDLCRHDPCEKQKTSPRTERYGAMFFPAG